MSDVRLEINPAAPAAAPQPDGVAPLARLLADKDRRVTFADRFGRQITIQKVRTSRRLALGMLIGEDASTELRISALAAVSVNEINGDPAGCNPSNRLMLDALLDRLDDGGIADVFTRYAEEYLGRAGDAEQQEARLGN
jgi:hypothetical protein